MALLGGPTAWAQQAAPTEQKAPEAVAAAPEGAPPAAPAPSEAASSANSVDERIAALEARLAKAEETAAAAESGVSSLKKLKFSGYVQGRYEWHQDAVDGWEKYKSENRFSVRHGYLAARYEGTYGEYFLQVDGNTSDGLVLKDAEATLVDPWTPFHFKLTLGQFKVPFGYEITQSDADRELPERAAVITGIFPSDRDRGLRLTSKYEFLRLSAAVVNGALSGIKDPYDSKTYVTVNGYDPNGFKTVVGRLGVDFGSIVGGLSGMWGKTLDTGTTSQQEVDYRTYKYYEQLRLGADVQGYIDVPGVGGLALKGEVIWARKKNLVYNDLKADPCLDKKSYGWIITLVQNVGSHGGVAVRVDQYDPMLASTVDATCHDSKIKEISARDKDKVTRLGVAGLLHASANTKLTVSYEHPWEQTGAKTSNDIVTAQLQARF
jgi:hypothetical protein